MDHSNATGSFYPCLDPVLFAPTNYSTEDWMAHAAALGSREICLTAHHEGGFALWPSNHTPYSVRLSSRFQGGHGDVLRDFAESANRWGIGICYYLNVASNGYLTSVANFSGPEFIAAEVRRVVMTILK